MLPLEHPGNIAHVIANVALNMQRLAGFSVTFSTSLPISKIDTLTGLVECRDEIIGSLACTMAISLVDSAIHHGPLNPALLNDWRRFNAVASRRIPDIPSSAIISAAIRRSIPVQTLDPAHHLFDLGNGAFRQRIQSSIPGRTSAVAERIALDKGLTNQILRSAGLPVPDGVVVHTEVRAAQAAADIGFPVVVKPVDRGGSAGVSIHLQTVAEVKASFPLALQNSPTGRVLIEQHIDGERYRAVVVNGRLNSAIEHLQAFVVGDGKHSVQHLIDIANADPRRGTRLSDALVPIILNDELLQELHAQGLALADIPADGRHVVLKLQARRGEGSYSIDRTDVVHPDNAAILVQACQVIGLDVGTIDLITSDISKSIWTSGGAIVDVNTGSGFNSELNPAEGQPRDPGPAIVDMLFPPGHPVRAPVIAVMGDSSHDVCEQIAAELGATGKSVGLATDARLVVGDMELKGVVRPGAAGIRTILNNPAVEVAVAEVTATGIVEEGLGFDYCDVAIILSMSGLQTPFDRPVESVVTNLLDASGALILVRDDPDSRALAADTPGQGVTIDRDSSETWIDEIVAEVSRRLTGRG